MTQDISPKELGETAKDFRAMAKDLTTRVLRLQNELGDMVRKKQPQDDIDAKRDEIDATSARINQCITTAIELDTKAALGFITSTDVMNPSLALICITSKIKLAVDNLNKIRSALRFVAAFIDIGAALVTLGASAGVSFANIKTLIEKIETLSKIENEGLSEEEIAQMKKVCLKVTSEN